MLFILMFLLAFFVPVASPQVVETDPSGISVAAGWSAEVDATIKNAATAEESFAASHGGRYTPRLADLRHQGLRFPQGIEVAIAKVGHGYCVQATDEMGTAHLSSRVGAAHSGPC